MRPATRYLRPDTGEIVEVLPGLGDHCFIVGTRKPNGSIKKFKSPDFPQFRSRALLQRKLDKWVIEKGGKWPAFTDPPAWTREAMDLKAAKAARKKWKVGDLVRIRNGEQYDGQLGRIYCVPSPRHPNWLYTVTLLTEGQEHTSDHCRYDEMELVEDQEMAKTAVAKRNAKEPGEAPFDYGELVPRDVAKCEQAVERIAGYQRRMAGDIVSIGKELLAVKERLAHGQFYAWIEHYFRWSRPTASRMMQAAETFKSFNLNALTIDQSALYLLSSDKCPDETREEIIDRAQQGERITHASVKQALSDLVADDDEPPKTRLRAREPDADYQQTPVTQKCVDDDDVDFDLAGFVTAMHRAVAAWRDRCPTRQLSDMAEVLRDIANQIEHAA